MKKPNYDWQANLAALDPENKNEVLIFDDDYISHIEGKVITLIEALIENPSDKIKHSAIKSLVNDAIWGDMHKGWATPISKDFYESFALQETATQVMSPRNIG